MQPSGHRADHRAVRSFTCRPQKHTTAEGGSQDQLPDGPDGRAPLTRSRHNVVVHYFYLNDEPEVVSASGSAATPFEVSLHYRTGMTKMNNWSGRGLPAASVYHGGKCGRRGRRMASPVNCGGEGISGGSGPLRSPLTRPPPARAHARSARYSWRILLLPPGPDGEP